MNFKSFRTGYLDCISQNIFSQYHIPDMFRLGLKNKKKCWKNKLNHGNHGDEPCCSLAFCWKEKMPPKISQVLSKFYS
jgi:hypothetical protein